MNQPPTPHSSELLSIPGKSSLLSTLTLPPQAPVSVPVVETETSTPQQERKTFKVPPPTDILSRLQAFLPQLQQANEELTTKDTAALDIEQVEEDEPYIEMNLGLGVYEEKQQSTAADSDSGSGSGSDGDGDNDIIMCTAKSVAKPTIEFVE
ncbi:hypothetical protein BDF14DRAFT_1035266 [Spinellus fusiger]|nr:hypothetical protein BDF14DRAFT_1035266 [Spinellus fusiger]